MLTHLFFSMALASVIIPINAAQNSSGSIERLSWLSGCWAQTRPDGLTEEHWMKPSGGTMLGMSRTVRGGRTTEFEFLQINEVGGNLAYVAKPSGQPEAAFPLRAMTDDEVVFENPTHDLPQRIIYRKGADRSVAARIEGMIEGKAHGVDLLFKACQ